MDKDAQSRGPPYSERRQNDELPSVNLEYLYGYDGKLKNNLFVVSDMKQGNTIRVCYTAGSTVVFEEFGSIKEIKDNKQTYLPSTVGTFGISCIQLSHSKRYLAVAEIADHAIISIYDLKPSSKGNPKDGSGKDGDTMKDLGGSNTLSNQAQKGGIIPPFAPIKRKTLISTSVNSTKYVALSFRTMGDEKILAALTDKMEVIIWEWEKSRPTISQDIHDMTQKVFSNVSLMFFYPGDENLVLMGSSHSKNHVMKVYSVKAEKQEVTITHKNDAKKEPPIPIIGTFVAYGFIDEAGHSGNDKTMAIPQQTILGTSDGFLYVMNKNLEVRLKLDSSPGSAMENMVICPYIHSKGFVVAGKSKKFLKFEWSEQNIKNPFVNSGPGISHKEFDHISVNAICQPTDDYIIAGLADGRLIRIKINTDKSGGSEGHDFRDLIYPFHKGTVKDISTSVMKPLLATCSSDKWVKIWNYETRGFEFGKEFEEEPKFVSFHPSGFHLAVAFNSKVKLLNLLTDRLEVFHDTTDKHTTALAYSNGGQYLAVGKNFQVNIYSSYTGELLSNMTLKDENSTITRILWHFDDFKIFTLGTDGHLIEWSFDVDKNERQALFKTPIATNANIGEAFDCTNFNLKDQQENTIVTSSKDKMIYTVQLKKDVHRLADKDSIETKKSQTFVLNPKQTGSLVTAVKFSNNHQILALGVYDQSKSSKFTQSLVQQGNNSSDNASAVIGMGSGYGMNSSASQMQPTEPSVPGVLRIYKYPLTGPVIELQTHGAPITKLLITRADSYLFTIGEDNLICSYKLTWDKDSSSKKLPFSDDYLYNRLDYIDKNREIALLTEKVKTTQEKIKKQNEELQQRKDREERDLQMKKLEEQRSGAMKIEEIKRQMKAMEESYDEKMEKLRIDNQKMFEEIEKNNENKMAKEGIRFDEKLHKKDDIEREYREKIVQLAQRHEEEIQRKREEYRQIIRAEEEKRVIEQDRIKVLKEQHEQRIKQLEEQSDADIDELRRKNDQILNNLDKEIDVQTSNLNKARAACSGKDNENRMADQNVDNIKKEINEATNAIQNEKQRKKNLESDIEERESTLRKKNDRIKELERKKQELEKFKFVLKYKIGELRREIGPREQQIAKLKEQLELMRSEIKEFTRLNGHLILFVNEFELQLKGKRKEIKTQSEKITQNNTYINAFESEISELCKLLDKNDEKEVRKILVGIYNKYVTNDTKISDINVDRQKKMISKREHLERDIGTSKAKYKENNTHYFMKNKRIQKQEVDLIMGINERYREYHDKLQAAKLAEMQAQLQKKPGQKAKEKRDWGNPTNIKEILSKRKIALESEIQNLAKQREELEKLVEEMSSAPLPKDFRM